MRRPVSILACLVLVLLASCSSARRAADHTALLPRPELTAEDQRRFDYYFDEAVRLLNIEQDAEAFSMFEHCLSIDSCSSAALFEMARIQFGLKRTDEGLRLLRRAVDYAPDNYWYSSFLAEVYRLSGALDEAVALLEDMTVRFPQKVDPLYTLMGIYDRREEYDKIIEVVNRLEQRTGKSEQLSMMKSQLYMQKGDTGRAFSEIQALIDEYPFDSRYRLALADAYLNNKREEEAFEICKTVLDEEPDNADAMYSLAAYYQRTGQSELYEQQVDSLLLNHKVATDTKVAIMRQLILRNSRADGDSLRLIRVFDRMMEQEPGEAEIPLLYAQYLLSEDMNAKAQPVLHMALDLDPTQTNVRMALLAYAVKTEDYEEIESLCRAGTELNPDVPEFYLYLAICCNLNEQTDEVIRVCQDALDHIPDNTSAELVSDFYNILGDAYHSKAMNTDAYAAYDVALELYPDNYSVLNNYAYYLSLEKADLDKAEEMSYKTIKAEPANATYLDTYAWILFVKGRYAEAKVYIDEAMKNNNDSSVEIIEHCGDIYAVSGDVDRALECWSRAKELGSDSTTLEEKIRRKTYIPKP